jgi:hypothetical protein
MAEDDRKAILTGQCATILSVFEVEVELMVLDGFRLFASTFLMGRCSRRSSSGH